ncbi:MAG: ParB N-terminal domain-containing protein [Candidatus Marsarchaeota archaeon]|jgi:hypothetical protein|nr:ParB N-terminal domain-containing protein [Candidatus Marsarchaeota archaeon]MCL5114968.1 ParB N-terminal domain-containing protein [Candidatus Marsarchaeota archaeon]
MQIVKLPIKDLLPHEELSQQRLVDLMRRVENDKVQRRPIVVSRIGEKFLIVDGHHRVGALKQLGYPNVLAMVIDFYLTDRVSVRGWSSDDQYDKGVIIERALRGDLYPPYTTKHLVRLDEGEWEPFHHHSILEPEMNISLEELGRKSAQSKLVRV